MCPTCTDGKTHLLNERDGHPEWDKPNRYGRASAGQQSKAGRPVCALRAGVLRIGSLPRMQSFLDVSRGPTSCWRPAACAAQLCKRLQHLQALLHVERTDVFTDDL